MIRTPRRGMELAGDVLYVHCAVASLKWVVLFGLRITTKYDQRQSVFLWLKTVAMRRFCELIVCALRRFNGDRWRDSGTNMNCGGY